MKEPLLSIRDLTVSFSQQWGRFEAVSHVSLDLYPGRSLGIVGESGSGKSLTALSVLNLLPPASRVDGGTIDYFNRNTGRVNILTATPAQIRHIRGNHISMIFQEPMTSLNPVYTCGYQVVEAILNHRSYSWSEARKLAVQWFSEVELPEPERIFRSYPHELSGGQRQRVMIAMAVSCEPRLLIADEPTTALDVTIQRSILSLLEQLKERYDMSLIFISHDLAVVSGIADDVAVMHQGAVVEKGHRQQVIHHPENGYTRGLIACRPPLDYRPVRLKTLADFISSRTGEDTSRGEENHAVATEKREKSTGRVIFSLQGVSKDFSLKTNFWGRPVEKLRALDQVSLDLRHGETLGLVGESGSGKSTLARLLLYLIRPDEGTLMYKGQDMAFFGRKEMQHFRQQVQIVFQDPYSTLNPRMSIGSMISEPLRYYGLYAGRKERRDRVVQLLESVRLGGDYYSRYPHELSGGQRQRVAIARVLALNPEFIICDEAVSALDVSIQAEILNLLQDLKQQFDLTYVFITHDFSVVRFMSDRIAVMKDGRVVETGASEDLFSRPSDPYTRRLLESIPSV